MAEIDELVQKLAAFDENELEAALGARARTIGENLQQGDTRAAAIDSFEVEMAVPKGIVEDALTAGQRMFNWISPAAYKLLCTPMGGEGSDETMQQLVKLLDEDLDKNVAKAAGMLAPFLTTNLGLAPAIAALVSTLIIKRVSKRFATFTCDAWQKSLQSTGSTEVSDTAGVVNASEATSA